MRLLASFAVLVLAGAGAVRAIPDYDALLRQTPSLQGVNLWRLRTRQLQAARASDSQQAQQLLGQTDNDEEHVLMAKFKAHYFEQPLDHFATKGAVNETFAQRYWINTRHYKPGGPVFVLDGGETSGANRLPFLDTGIMEILPKATGGIGVILEHRYYGASIPVLNLSTDSLRWLNNDQSAADSANFMRNVNFEGVKEDITAPGTPWIYYGGSYAGARAAHMRVLYPDIVYGAIASSAATHAFISYWEYMDTIRLAMDPECSDALQRAILVIDYILGTNNGVLIKHLKKLFGVDGLKHDEDFGSLLSSPLGSWQGRNWDPAVDTGSEPFNVFCKQLTAPVGHFSTEEMDVFGISSVLSHDDGLHAVTGPLTVPFGVLNYAKYIRENIVSQCDDDVEECFGTFDPEKFRDTGLDQTWRKWMFQVCTEWGYFFTAPPADTPRIVSRLHTLAYASQLCPYAFPPGKEFSIPGLPNVTAVNAIGDFAIAADRLAIIDGEVDPWKPVTPHSRYAEDREHTRLRPFLEIKGGVHHWDENGLANPEDEPEEIKKVHAEMIAFVKEWLADWKKPKA